MDVCFYSFIYLFFECCINAYATDGVKEGYDLPYVTTKLMWENNFSPCHDTSSPPTTWKDFCLMNRRCCGNQPHGAQP